jgi:hypothetical protein
MDVPDRSPRPRTRAGLLRCGVVAGPVFTSVFLVEGAIRPDYNPLRHPISSLSLGPTGWSQRVNFWVTGGLYVAGALGLWRSRTQSGLDTRAGPILLGTVGVGLIGAGVFPCDPINGYPPGTVGMSARTPTGQLHDLFSSPVFLCLPAAAAVYARAASRAGDRTWVLSSLTAAVTQIVAFVAAGAGFSQEQPALMSSAGAFQRASVVAGFGWLSAWCAHALRSSARSDRARTKSHVPTRVFAGRLAST